MANIRDDIAKDIVRQLQGISDPAVVLVSRNPINITDLSMAQYPAIVVRTTSELRTDETMRELRFGEVEYTISCYVRAQSSATTVNNSIDEQKNTLVEAVEEKLEGDRTRDGKALNSYVTNVVADDGSIFPIGRVDITYIVRYKYTRGTL